MSSLSLAVTHERGSHAEPRGAVERLSPGGGGFGDPRERDPDLVRRDVAAGLVSRGRAAADYGVEP